MKKEKEIIKRTTTWPDGITTTRYFEKDKLNLGAFRVEIEYPKDFMSLEEENKLKNKGIPKTQQKFINPLNGKEIGYARARALNLI